MFKKLLVILGICFISSTASNAMTSYSVGSYGFIPLVYTYSGICQDGTPVSGVCFLISHCGPAAISDCSTHGGLVRRDCVAPATSQGLACVKDGTASSAAPVKMLGTATKLTVGQTVKCGGALFGVADGTDKTMSYGCYINGKKVGEQGKTFVVPAQ